MALKKGDKTVLVVVDVQKGVVATAHQRDEVVSRVATAVERARRAGVGVVWVQHQDEELVKGSEAWQLADGLQPLPGEVRLDKRYNSSFEDTALETVLDGQGASHVVLAGAATNWCIRATAYGALERGYDLTLVSDAHTTESIAFPDGRVVEAKDIIADLNVAMSWVSYPGRRNEAVQAADLFSR